MVEQIIPPLALFLALVATPWLLARLCAPKSDWPATGAFAGVSAITLTTLIPLALHLAKVPIRPLTLATPHLALFALTTLAFLLSRRPLFPQHEARSTKHQALLCWMALSFSLLILPITRLAGIDTYKWQGLATNVRVEECIPWLIHPASLLGFTPRAYPPAHPLLLATTQILGGLGVEFGFYVTSLLIGLTGLCLAYIFARRVFTAPRDAAWFTFFYVFSPIFMRYTHWATGRGLFVALLPLLLLALLPRKETPSVPPQKIPSPWCPLRAFVSLWFLLFACLLLALTHKAGLVAIALLLPATLFSFFLPFPRSSIGNRQSSIINLLFLIPFLLAAIALSPSLMLPPPAGNAIGFLRTAITRFGCLLPLAALGILAARGWLQNPALRRLFPAMLLTLPLAFPRDMYGALIALPFITLAATSGLAWLRDTFPRFARPLAIAAILATTTGALAIVTARNLAATPPRIYRAAQFLEHYDPLGPYQVFAPGRARVQIHAYVSGCPRFVVATNTTSTLSVRTLPSLEGPLEDTVVRWIDFGRNFMEVSDVAVDWYGINPRAYYVDIDGVSEGERPDNLESLYTADGIQIFKPATQPKP